MTHNIETLDDRLNGSQYDPVIWEDIKPLEQKLELLEQLFDDLIDTISSYLPEDAKNDLFEIKSAYEKIKMP